MRDILTLAQLQAVGVDKAAATLAARLADPTGDHDHDLLAAWLALDPAHERAWDHVQGILALFSAGPAEGASRESLQVSREEPAIGDLDIAKPRKVQRWAIAAGVAILLASGSFFAMKDGRRDGGTIAAASPSAATFSAPFDQDRSVKLADGSEMLLRSGASIDVSFSEGRRRLSLVQGGAKFRVAHDASRPFVVTAGGHDVTALGTQFETSIRSSRFEVMLLEGSVSVTTLGPQSDPIILRPGQKLVQEASLPAVVSSIARQTSSSSSDAIATFHDETLGAVAERLNRDSRDKLVVRDPKVAQLRISGTFRTGDVARFARTLAEIYPLRVVRAGEHVWELVPSPRKVNGHS